MRFLGILLTQVLITYLWLLPGALFDSNFSWFIFLLPKVALVSIIILWWLDIKIKRRWIFYIVLIVTPPLVLSGVLVTQSSLEQFF